MAIIGKSCSGYSGYLIDATQLANLTSVVGDVERYASSELQSRQFVDKLKNSITLAANADGAGDAGNALLDNMLEMLRLTKVSSTDIASVTNALTVLRRYLDNNSYPYAQKNARGIVKGLGTTLNQITYDMMYSGMNT